MSKQQGSRQQALAPHAPQPQESRSADHPRASVVAHRHGRGHLVSGGDLRCGCGPEVLGTDSRTADPADAPGTTWVPLRRQLTGFVRAHFIYSDRMLLPSQWVA